ncbi:hypothetical protein CN585_14375 [Bacillus toyonensis]|uniref:Uncharacterized protein n=1 Tax=Bacillus toyonensis TaxID=155322 RepID=A0A2A8HEM2_9BACI|nr:hypothetical protein CN585_14375 [Bacillus toyonensis]
MRPLNWERVLSYFFTCLRRPVYSTVHGDSKHFLYHVLQESFLKKEYQMTVVLFVYGNKKYYILH